MCPYRNSLLYNHLVGMDCILFRVKFEIASPSRFTEVGSLQACEKSQNCFFLSTFQAMLHGQDRSWESPMGLQIRRAKS
jgi:hypothetical protein